jgi:geranylgeranyl reductase family protein
MTRPSTYDALVIGAGPAGSAAAWQLARAGLRVALADRAAFPRDKVCGDALIPDALGAVDAMGLRAAVDAEAVRCRELRVYPPNGRFVSITGAFSCLRRVRFDQMLVDAASAAGAEVLERHEAVTPLVDGARVEGGTFRSPNGTRAISAFFTLLATGANATAMSAFGLGAPLKPNAVAGRAYFEVPPDLARRFDHLCIAFERSLLPGYGWIFPGPGNRYNVGCGYFDADRGPHRSLHDLWDRFLTGFAPAAEIARASTRLTEFRGAPLRTGLAGARFGRPGLLVLGEAAAMTYPATGEGIGKAMESGLIAADLVAQAVSGGRSGDAVHEQYEAEFRGRFGARYGAYGVAERWTSRAWMLNLVAWRANAGTFARREVEALMAEQGDPRRLFSPAGLLTSIFR